MFTIVFSGYGVSIRFGNASYAGKTSDEAFLSYSLGAVACNVSGEKALDRLVGEPAAGQETHHPTAVAGLRGHAFCPLALGFEHGEAGRRRLGCDTLRF